MICVMIDARPRLEGLDGLRATAALAVVVFHLQPHDALRVRALATHAYLAVDLFFMISGFILAQVYGGALAKRAGAAGFLGRRLTRLLPMCLLGAVLGLAAFALARPEAAALGPAGMAALLGLAVVQLPWCFGGDPRAIAFPLNPPSWSLSLELWGNLVYALVAPRLSNRLLVLLVAAGAAGLVATALLAKDLNLGGGQGDVWAGWVRFLFAFSAGIGLQRLGAAGRIPALRPPDWLGPCILAGLLLAPAAGGWTVRAGVDLFAILLVFPAMVAAALTARSSRLSGVLGFGARLSYPLYATHAATLMAVGWAASRLHAGHAAAAIWSLAIAIAVAVVAERWFDTPVRAWLARRPAPGAFAALRAAPAK